MGEIKTYTPAKLVIGILISDLDQIQSLLNILDSMYGPFDFKCDILDFTYTHYYDEEMGSPIFRLFVSSQQLRDPSDLATIKICSNSIESQFVIDGKRKINIDPGYLFLSKFILASTKDGSYRIPLSAGIFGEITLVYVKNKFCNTELTYPDFQSDTYKNILKEIREIYKTQLKSL